MEQDFKVSLEVPAVFNVTLFFINHTGEYTSVNFALPPGIYPAERWVETAINDAYSKSLKALKTSTKNLSWRKVTPLEFVRATSPAGQKITVEPKWQPAFSNQFEFEKLPDAPVLNEGTTNDNNSL